MSKVNEIRKMIAEATVLNNKIEAKVNAAKSAIKSEIGLEIKTSTEQEKDGELYYSYCYLLSVGDIDFDMDLSRLDQVDIPLVTEALKKIKRNPDAMDAVIQEVESTYHDDSAVSLIRLCMKIKKSPEEAIGLLGNYISLCEYNGQIRVY